MAGGNPEAVIVGVGKQRKRRNSGGGSGGDGELLGKLRKKSSGHAAHADAKSY